MNKKVYKAYLPHYGWVQCSEEFIGEVPNFMKKRVVKVGGGKQYVMVNSSGVREPSVTQVTGGKVLLEQFLQSYYTTYISCVCL